MKIVSRQSTYIKTCSSSRHGIPIQGWIATTKGIYYFEVYAEDIKDVSNADTARHGILMKNNINKNNGTVGVPFVI